MEKEYNVDELLKNVDFYSNSLTKVNDNLMLTNYQIDVLKRNDIDPQNYNSLREIIYLAEQAYEETLDEELDIILNELGERDYYENKPK